MMRSCQPVDVWKRGRAGRALTSTPWMAEDSQWGGSFSCQDEPFSCRWYSSWLASGLAVGVCTTGECSSRHGMSICSISGRL